MRFSRRSRSRLRAAAASVGIGMVAVMGAVVPISATASTASAATTRTIAIRSDGTGLKPGSIKHVWLIILENKSYDATFTGLNQNSYLWKTLPAQGVLLKDYYGTGHSSMDNYLSLVSGQAPNEDVQEDCATTDSLINSNSGIQTAGGSLRADPNYGQLDSKGGADAPLGSNGCSFPTEVPTLFNQLNAAGVSWKGYAQDLGGEQNYVQHPDTAFQSDTVPTREDAACGGAGTSANNPSTDPTNLNAPTGDVASFTGAQNTTVGGTTYVDQYVAKHFPFPWFESLTGQVNATGPSTPALNEPAKGSNCDADHIANLDDPTDGLVHDLSLPADKVPAFNWITPNNCSDAHDAVCKGNNLSGAFNADGTPNYETGTPYAYDPETIPPKNYTGGLYASDLFLEYYIPLIEQSAAFKDGGLIDVTFDEANPPFTYTGNSFNNVPTTGRDQPADAPTYGRRDTTVPGADSIYGAYGIVADEAGENIDGRNVHFEPTGPNSTLSTNAEGDQLDPGPGNNSFIDRPPACTSTDPDTPANCVPGIVRGGSGTTPGARTDAGAAGSASSSYIVDDSIVADDTGRGVTGTNIPSDSFVGAVTDTGPNLVSSSSGSVTNGQFQLVNDAGDPVDPTGPVSGITVSAEGAPGALSGSETTDPLYDATDPTPGGGDTGSVLISPYIHPGTSTSRYYNHYSWLKTMEDIFNVSSCDRTARNVAIPGGTVCGGLDGQGHIGYAAQAGLAPFGRDVFNNPEGVTRHHRPWFQAGTLGLGLPIGGLLVVGLYVAIRRRQQQVVPAI